MSLMDINYAMETTGKYIKTQLVQTSRSLKLRTTQFASNLYKPCCTMPWGHTMLYNALGSYFCCLLPSHIHITRFPYENVFISFCPRLGLNSDVWNLKLGPTKWATLKQWCPINFLISSKSYQKCVVLVLRESARIFLCYSFVGCFYSTSKDEFKCVSQNK